MECHWATLLMTFQALPEETDLYKYLDFISLITSSLRRIYSARGFKKNVQFRLFNKMRRGQQWRITRTHKNNSDRKAKIKELLKRSSKQVGGIIHVLNWREQNQPIKTSEELTEFCLISWWISLLNTKKLYRNKWLPENNTTISSSKGRQDKCL